MPFPAAQLLAFGDGYVEIQNTKGVGGLAVAVASDEAHNGSGVMDAWKRQRLLGVGADVVIPDFRDAAPCWTDPGGRGQETPRGRRRELVAAAAGLESVASFSAGRAPSLTVADEILVDPAAMPKALTPRWPRPWRRWPSEFATPGGAARRSC